MGDYLGFLDRDGCLDGVEVGSGKGDGWIFVVLNACRLIGGVTWISKGMVALFWMDE